jgi:Tol biopolymer transport system component
LVNTINHHNIEDEDFVWTPDDRIIYISKQSIYVSDLSTPIITFPKTQGVPGEPSISPDGNKVVFTLGEDTSEGVKGTIWVVNIDGTGLRQLTIGDTDLSISPSHKTAIWSPDGKWIFMIDKTSIEGNAYIVPANAEKVEITQKRNTEAIPFFSYYLEIISEGTDPIKLSTTFGAYGNISWLP